MALLLSTTGTPPTVIIEDLGARTFNHPDLNFDLETEYELWEALESEDLLLALTNSEITLSFNGIDLNPTQFQNLARGNMQTAVTTGDFIYDADADYKVDEANVADTSVTSTTAADSNLLQGQNGPYYLDRLNHTGTQLATTISDFVPTSRQAISVDINSQSHLQYDPITGIFTATPGSLINVIVDSTYLTMQDWIDNVYVGDEGSYQEGDILILANAVPSDSWIRNDNNPAGTSGGAGISDWTQLSNDRTDTEIKALFSATTPLEYNVVTGNYSILQSGVAQDGYLSSTDWNTFNDKQGALTPGAGIDITVGTISLDVTAYTSPSGISMAAAAGQIWQVSSDTSIHLESPLVEIKPLAVNSDAILKLEPTGATNISAIEFFDSADTAALGRISNNETAGAMTISSLGNDLNIQGVGGVVDIQSTTGAVQIQNISYPDSTTGNNGDVLVYDGLGELTFQSIAGGLSAGDGIDISNSIISVDLAANSGLDFAAGTNGGTLKIADSVAGSGITLTTGVLSVDTVDLTGTIGNGVSGVLPPENGGTGVDTSSAANGQLLIGNGAGLTLNTLSSGGTIAVTNGVGTISLDVAVNSINNTHIDYGVTGDQVNASVIPILDVAGNYTATNVEDALTEISNNFDNISTDAASISYDGSTSGLASNNVQDAIDEVNAKVEGPVSVHSDVDTTGVVDGDLLVYNSTTSEWLPANPSTIGAKRSWTISAGTANNNVTNRYLNWFAGSHNVSPYVIPLNATVKFISAGTRVNETWIAEVRVNGVVATSLTITATNSAVSAELAVDANAGDLITFYCNGSQINRPSMSVLFDER